MRATLQFELPDEAYLFECSNKGFTIVSELELLQQTLRSNIKHGHNYKSVDELLDYVYDEISIILSQVTVEG